MSYLTTISSNPCLPKPKQEPTFPAAREKVLPLSSWSLAASGTRSGQWTLGPVSLLSSLETDPHPCFRNFPSSTPRGVHSRDPALPGNMACVRSTSTVHSISQDSEEQKAFPRVTRLAAAGAGHANGEKQGPFMHSHA